LSGYAANIGKRHEPVEVILRGYRSPAQQYAAINHYEQLAGRICEDYARDPPPENRRYKSELRDPALTRRQALTAEERIKVNNADSGVHWVKVTFESAEAADTAMSVSPQSILGHVVYCEPYHGIPPNRDEAVVDTSVNGNGSEYLRSPSKRRHDRTASYNNRQSQRLDIDAGASQQSQASSRTADTTTMTSDGSTRTVSSGTITGNDDAPLAAPPAANPDNEFCTAIPTARKMRLLPAEQALLPQSTYTQRLMSQIPFLKWFNGTMIGNEVPRTETGEFDWDKASLYWKFIYWLDSSFGLFGGEIVNADKED
jgi:hypothetical protein